MKKISFFKGRVVIGRFTDDQLGFEGRRLFRSLQTIAKTYHLPGPSLLPITKRVKGSKPTKTGYLGFGTSNFPALIIYGSKGVYELNFPPVTHVGLTNCDLENGTESGCSKDFPRNTQMLRLSQLESAFLAVPSYPLSLRISREPKFVIEHYLEWISAYFSPLINDSVEARSDVLYEAATLEGLSGTSNERLFSKLLISYEQVCSWSFDKSSFNIVDARRRLFDIKERLKFNKNPELYAVALNLLAVTEILIPSSGDDFGVAEDVFIELLNSKKVSYSQKSIAAHNLGVIQSFK